MCYSSLYTNTGYLRSNFERFCEQLNFDILKFNVKQYTSARSIKKNNNKKFLENIRQNFSFTLNFTVWLFAAFQFLYFLSYFCSVELFHSNNLSVFFTSNSTKNDFA